MDTGERELRITSSLQHRSNGSSVMVAAACMRIGNRDCALRWPEEGFEERDDLMINLKAEHVFDNLRVDSRFQDLIHRVGIPQ